MSQQKNAWDGSTEADAEISPLKPTQLDRQQGGRDEDGKAETFKEWGSDFVDYLKSFF